MFQRVNLYKEKKPHKIILPLRQIMIITLVLIIILCCDTIYMVYGYYRTAIELRKLTARQERLNKGLVSAQKAIPTEEQKTQLQKTLTELQQINSYREKMYATLTQLHYQDSTGLSIYLNSMADQPIADLWLTKFHLEQNGTEISLEGITLNSSSVPKYLEELGKTKIFGNRNFEKLQIFFDEPSQQIKFIVSSKGS